MATPTRSQVVSTPKNPLSSTPNRSNASPRPNLGPFANKTVAGKSPAVKTPASLQGHAHRISVSSHPTSTPLAASVLADDMMNLNSPAAALMASMAPTGLTPLPSTQDGLGISTGMPGAPSTQDGPASKNPQKERHDRLKEIAQILKTKTQARGASRANVQTLARIHGFEPYYIDEDDPDTLTLLGKEYVVLDTVFGENRSNVVRKSRLKLNDPATGEDDVPQKDASQVLTRNLTQDTNQTLPWHDLTHFSANLEYLSQMERVSTGAGVNCFKIIDNLYDTFQKIWVEEKKRMKWRHDVHHLCQSNIGEPTKDEESRLGVSARYWTKGQKFYAREEPKTPTRGADEDEWTARFSIEAGSPSMIASQNWISDDSLTSTARAEDIFQESAVDKPSWQHPASSSTKLEGSDESMDVGRPNAIPKTYDVHFVCSLEPPILLPYHAAQSLNETFNMLEMRQEQLTTFQQSSHRNQDSSSTTKSRWTRPQHVFTKHGTHEERTHSYTLYTSKPDWAYPASKLSFSHPHQFADVVPTLRQYALVNTLLQSMAPLLGAEPNPPNLKSPSAPTSKDGKELVIRDGRKLWVRSNKSKLESRLDAIMSRSKAEEYTGNSALPIDVRLDTALDTATRTCKFELTAPISTSILPRAAMSRLKAKDFLKLKIEILPGGVVEIVDIHGIELEQEKTNDLKKRLARVIRCSEDIGTIVAWAMRELESV